MELISFSFIALIFGALLVYYLVPAKWQWVVLLVASGVFYAFVGWQACFFVLITASTIYGATVFMSRLAKKDKRRKAIYVTTLLLNLGVLCVFKYLAFALELIAPVLAGLGANAPSVSLIAPLGISFYTFQAVGYLTDVYWGNTAAEKNYFKCLLFVSFFPQMTQGPISDFKQLSGQIFAPHKYNYRNFSWGFWRLVWGFAKKMLLANYLDWYCQSAFMDFGEFSGLSTFILIFLYAIEVYADFSGYMDIVCGACEMFGITLTENFVRPYFSKDVSEYWRRWHITMGTWFKKYVYYPVATSRLNQRFAKFLRKHTSRHIARSAPATIALIVTWFTTGLWHRASVGYIVWGLLNGFVIIVSLWLEPVYAWLREKLHINASSWLFRGFQVARTFFIISIIKVLPDARGIGNGLKLIAHAFTAKFLPDSFTLDTVIAQHAQWRYGYIGIFMILLMFIVDIVSYRRPAREYIFRLPLAVRAVIMAAFIAAIFMFGDMDLTVGFMYAQY